MKILAKTKIEDMAITPRDGYKVVHFKISDDLSDFYPLVDKLPDNVELSLSTTSPKSQRANNYYWSIVGELVWKLEMPKDDIHRHLIREFGLFQDEDYKNEEVDAVRKEWESRGSGWQSEILYEEDGWTSVRFYYGLSAYDSYIMRVFLNFVYEYAVDHGVRKSLVGTRQQIDEMATNWKGNKNGTRI